VIRLRPAEPADEWIAWELRKQIQSSLTREQHQAWWEETKEHRFIALDGEVTVGIIRLSSGGWSEVHILVSEPERGKGYGPEMLEAILPIAAALGKTTLWAMVGRENVASQRAFLAAGYLPTRFEVTL
jgi:RimJ/RimL family protein N-acetyltransferase